MIVIYHKNNKVLKIEFNGENLSFSKTNIAKTLFEIADTYSDELIIWCHFYLKSNLNHANIKDVFYHNKIMASYNLASNSFLDDAIGYVEGSPFIRINKNVAYTTWQMSSSVGGIHSSVLLPFKYIIKVTDNFDYFLNSLAKLAMPSGLLCYSEPALLSNVSVKTETYKQSPYVLFRFVKQHYKMSWVFLLFFNMFLYERRIAILPLVFSLFYSKRIIPPNFIEKIKIQSSRKVINIGSLDVVIPTIGRKKYLYDILKDLSVQTHLPENVIIIEQNPNSESKTELDYITNEVWPFNINHKFTHQAGACNARNLALAEVKSEWVFMADDDIRIEKDFIENALKNINQFGAFTGTFGCYPNNYPESKKHAITMQWTSFGSGCSIVKSHYLKNIEYNSGFEFGYREDSDFGMQLRNNGVDVIYFPTPEIIHLKAPIGGFRTKPALAWANDDIQPKPSPTVMLYNLLHLTVEQIKGYKTILFFKFYSAQTIKNPVRYLNNFEKQWKQSLYWANKLKNNS